jgi:hypothetical protein
MRKIKLLAAATLMLAGGVSGGLWADDENVDVAATFRRAIELNEVNSVDFTTNLSSPGAEPIEFTATPGASDWVRLATDDSLDYDGVFIGPATGQAGEVTIVGDDESVVYVSCADTAIMRNAGGGNVTVNMQFKMNTGGNWAAGTDCAGVTDTSFEYTLNDSVTTDTILLGGEIVGNNTITSDPYSTANAGTPAVLRVVYK